MIEAQTKWTRREKQLADPNPPSGSQIRADERKNGFQRHAESVAPVADDMALKNRFARKQTVQEQQTEGNRNRFGDKLGPVADPREKLEPTTGKHTAANEWHGKPIPRSSTGRPLDEETLRLKQAADTDRTKRVNAKERAKLGLSENSQRKETSPDDVLAYLFFLHNARPDIPMDETERPGDERWRNAIITNSWNIKRAWLHLKSQGLAELDLSGLLLAVKVCEENNAVDFCKSRVRGFADNTLVNIIDEPPQASEEDKALHEAMSQVRSGQARFSRMRPATQSEATERAELKNLPFSELAAKARAGYKK
jgi:hypothetical protein